MDFVKNFKNLPSKTRSLISFGLLIALVIALPLFVWSITNLNFNPKEKAQSVTPNATIRFEPGQASLPPVTQYDIWIDSDSSVGFASIILNFDKNLINLAQEIEYTNKLDQEVITTTKSNANTYGQIIITRGLSPQNINNAPSGSFKIATLTLESQTNTDNTNASIVIADNSQIVAMDQSVFNLNFNNLQITLNPVATTAPTATATSSTEATILPTATATATATSTSTAETTITPSPTSTSSSKIGDISNDGIVNIVDLGIVIDHYGENTNDYSKGDINNDSLVNIVDVGLIIDNYQF